MPDNLDQQWDAQKPPEDAEHLTFTFMGQQLVRQPEVPVIAFRLIEEHPNDFSPLVEAIKMCLHPSCHDAFMQLVPVKIIDEAGNESYTDGALTVPRCSQIWRYLVERGTGRPLSPPPASPARPTPNGTPSTDTQPSIEAWTSGASVPGAS